MGDIIKPEQHEQSRPAQEKAHIPALEVQGPDVGFFLGWSALFVLLRLYNVSQWWGTWVMGLVK